MMKFYPVHAGILTLALTSILTGCNLGTTVDGSGDIMTEERQVPTFRGLVIKGNANANIQIGTEQNLAITTDDNILKILRTTVSDGILTIDSEDSYSATQGVMLDITVSSMESIVIKGSGNIDLEGTAIEAGFVPEFNARIEGSGTIAGSEIHAEKAIATIQGSGGIRLTGKGAEINALVSGSGDIFAEDFPASRANATIKGSGEIKVNASDTFEGDISGSGDISYAGNPATVVTSVSGTGDFIKLP